jgi:BirA family biotin operon repressor/biotin-[acetyl-CoA-carboxylase] ligase
MLRATKVAGILAEVRDGAVVLGIGINLNQARKRLPDRAGSLFTQTGLQWDRDLVLDAVLNDLARRYDQWRAGGLDAIYEGLGARDFLRGRQVTVDGNSGVAELIDRQGRLRVAVGGGEHVTVESGEVSYER